MRQVSIWNKRISREQDNLIEVPIPEVSKENWMSPGEANINHIRTVQVQSLNNVLRKKWKKERKRHVAPKLEFGPRPDNPWRDRYMLCGDCERSQDFRRALPKTGCNCSTLLELDMAAPWSRDNVMAISCDVAQMVREDVWVRRDEEGQLRKVEGKHKCAGSYPVQVCAVCRKTSLDEGRRFRMCATCEGVSYCSDECYAQDRLRHKAWCTKPMLPERKEWGVRKQLRSMRGDIYPMIKTWAIREPEDHRIAWLPKPKRQDAGLLDGPDVRRPSLPGFRMQEHLLPMASRSSAEVRDGRVAIVVQPQGFRLSRPMRPGRGAAEPDAEQLLALCMTREEFVRRDAQLWAKAAREDEELSLAAAVAREAAAASAAPAAASSGPRLDAEAVERVEAAARDAPEEPPPAQAPWEELEEQEQVARSSAAAGKAVRRMATGSTAGGAAAKPAERPKGVVPLDSPVQSIAKERGLRLSKEALERLEAAAAVARENEHRIPQEKPLQLSEYTTFEPPQREYKS